MIIKVRGGANMRFYVIKVPGVLRGLVRGIFGLLVKE